MNTAIRNRLDSYLVRAECPLCGHDREGIFVRGDMGELVCRNHRSHPLHPEHGLTLLARLRAEK